MKEFAMRHPILTFLLADSAIGGVVAICKAIIGGFSKNPVVEEAPAPAADTPVEKPEVEEVEVG